MGSSDLPDFGPAWAVAHAKAKAKVTLASLVPPRSVLSYDGYLFGHVFPRHLCLILRNFKSLVVLSDHEQNVASLRRLVRVSVVRSYFDENLTLRATADVQTPFS